MAALMYKLAVICHFKRRSQEFADFNFLRAAVVPNLSKY